MADKPEKAKKSRLWADRRPIQLIAVGMAAGLWLFGLADRYAIIVIICLPTAVIYNYEWLHRVLHQTPQK